MAARGPAATRSVSLDKVLSFLMLTSSGKPGLAPKTCHAIVGQHSLPGFTNSAVGLQGG